MRPPGIQCQQLTLLVGLEDFVNCLDRAHRNAGPAIDANIRIYIAPLAVRVEALDRTMFDTISKEAEAAIVRNDVGHAAPDPELEPSVPSARASQPTGWMHKGQILSTSTRLSE
jgi:hypothetical protein